MKIQTKMDEPFIEVRRIVIKTDNIEYRISLDRFENIIFNKFSLDSNENTIIINPSASNEIKIK
jgi:hypothetical protein